MYIGHKMLLKSPLFVNVAEIAYLGKGIQLKLGWFSLDKIQMVQFHFQGRLNAIKKRINIW